MRARDAGLDQEREQGDPVGVVVVLGGGVEFFAVAVEVGDVGFVVVRDVGDVEPGAVQEGSGDFLDPWQGRGVDGPERGEVLRGDLRDPRAGRGRGGGLGRALQEPQQVVLGDAALGPGRGDCGQVHAQLPGGAPHGGPGVYPGGGVDSTRRWGRGRGSGRRRGGRRRGRGGCGLLLFHQ